MYVDAGGNPFGASKSRSKPVPSDRASSKTTLTEEDRHSFPSSVLDRTSRKSNSTNNSSKMQEDVVMVGVDEENHARLPPTPQRQQQQQQDVRNLQQQDVRNLLAIMAAAAAEGEGETTVAAAASLPPTLLPNDIACERGGLNTSHPGNLQYLKILQEQNLVYQNIKSCRSRTRFVGELLGRLKADDIRFVERHKLNRCENCHLKKKTKYERPQLPCFCDWKEIDNRKAKKKITTGLRDLLSRPQQAGQAIKQRAERQTATAMASVAVGGGSNDENKVHGRIDETTGDKQEKLQDRKVQTHEENNGSNDEDGDSRTGSTNQETVRRALAEKGDISGLVGLVKKHQEEPNIQADACSAQRNLALSGKETKPTPAASPWLSLPCTSMRDLLMSNNKRPALLYPHWQMIPTLMIPASTQYRRDILLLSCMREQEATASIQVEAALALSNLAWYHRGWNPHHG